MNVTTHTTLKQRADFLRLNRGRKYITDYVILRYAATPEEAKGGVRVGYTVTIKCGNAVIRNRIRRRLRAIVRELAPQIKPGMDYVFIARADAAPSAAEAPIAELRAALAKAFEASAR